jgi:hypothetical protein
MGSAKIKHKQRMNYYLKSLNGYQLSLLVKIIAIRRDFHVNLVARTYEMDTFCHFLLPLSFLSDFSAQKDAMFHYISFLSGARSS